MRIVYSCALLAAAAAVATASLNADGAAANGVIINEQPLPEVPAGVPRGALRAHFDKYLAAFIEAPATEAGGKKKAGKKVERLFTCLDGKQTIFADRVNDEYCDCDDGSDEPGTAACSLEALGRPDWRFRCADSGSKFKDRTFKHSQVNDGICDCCDGSDEYAGHMNCPNTCAELGAEEEKAHSEREEKRRLGLEEKRKMEEAVNAKIASALATVEENEKKAAAAEALLGDMRARKEAAERVETVAKEEAEAKYQKAIADFEAEKAARLAEPHLLKPMWGCVRWAQTRDCRGDAEFEDFNQTCDFRVPAAASGACVCRKRTEAYLAKLRAGVADLKADTEKLAAEIAAKKEKEREGAGANGAAAADAKPAAEEGAVAVDAEIAADDEEDDERPEDDRINHVQHPELFNKQQEERLVGVEPIDTLLRYDCGHEAFTCEEMCEFGGDEAIRAAHRETYKGDTRAGSAFETPEATAARAEFVRVESEYNNAKRAAEEAKKVLETLQQPDITPAFRAMNGLCYERQFHNYKYSFCPFSRASQDSISLGSWQGFGEQTYSSWGAKYDFSIMKFAGGTQCWGGPQRSLTVRVVCGPTNEILSVEEPSMCAYRIKFQSPAICE